MCQGNDLITRVLPENLSKGKWPYAFIVLIQNYYSRKGSIDFTRLPKGSLVQI